MSTTVRMTQWREQLRRDERRLARLVAYGATVERFEAGVRLMLELHGLFGVNDLLHKTTAALLGEQSEASLDSELSLVLWPEYEPAGWIANPLRRSGASPTGDSRDDARRTLMVSRLDAPNPTVVQRMIDDSIRAEKQGLSGTFYVDARGVKRDQGLITYDRDLFDLFDLVRRGTSMRVVLDKYDSVFPPGQCPDAALYCGWYSLERYVDAFDFVRGAVAVHIASFELRSLRDGDKPRWCGELLKDGAAATFGAVHEPYLQAFPPPTHFFGYLMTGRYTLVEAFYMSKPYNSWMLSLLGDPLYNPFRARPMLPADWSPRTQRMK